MEWAGIQWVGEKGLSVGWDWIVGERGGCGMGFDGLEKRGWVVSWEWMGWGWVGSEVMGTEGDAECAVKKSKITRRPIVSASR